MSYKTIRNEAVGEYEEKKSLFIGSSKRVSSEEEARNFINTIKSKHKDARHNVYAYIVGENSGIQRYSDDGEPQGTGGIPVLEVIKKNEITDTVIVVTRYFGGVLLGAAGLCRAYSKAAALAVKNAGVVEKVRGTEMKIAVAYDLLGKIQYEFNQKGWQIENIDYTDKVEMTILSESHMINDIEQSAIDLTGGRCECKKNDEDIYFMEEGKLYKVEG